MTRSFDRMPSAADYYVFRSEFAKYFAYTQFLQKLFALDVFRPAEL